MLLVIGLDGATLRLADEWMAQGKLPVLDGLRRRGRWGVLRSTVPPATLPSWTTFMTGVNPGRHGIFDFTRRDSGTYRVRFVNSTFRKAPSVWRLLSDAGRRVAVLGMPGTYPPEAVNGCMVSGFDAPVTTRATRSFIYPRELADDVMRLGGFTFADFQEFHVGPGWHRTALSRLLGGVERKRELAQALLGRGSWDCFCLVFGETDTVSHHFWHFYDRRSPRHDASAAVQFRDAIELVYRAADAAIGELLTQLPRDCDVLIASDHGFGGAGDRALHLNRFLANHGWLRFGNLGRGRWAGVAKEAALRVVPVRWQAAAFRAFHGRLAGGMESRARFAGIDWRHTRAFSEELNYFPSISINCAGREPEGQVAAAEYDSLCDEIRAALLEWRDPESGAPVVDKVWHRREVYDGPWVEHAPDLILELAEDRGFSYCTLPSRGETAELRTLTRRELAGGKKFSMSGSHRSDGMFIVASTRVTTGRCEAEMNDMAPTILNLCGLPAATGMEGRSLLAASTTAELQGSAGENGEERFYSADDEAVLEERLRALGYLG